MADPGDIAQKTNSKVQVSKVAHAADPKNMTYNFQIETPSMMVSNRTMFVTFYVEKEADTGVVYINSSSKGTQALEASMPDLVGSNVVGQLHLSYIRLEPM